MKSLAKGVTFGGHLPGIIVLIIIQFTVGIIHVFMGFSMLLGNFPITSQIMTSTVYCVYTLVYGCLTTFFAYLLWTKNRFGWIGTVAISFFVILVDTLTVFNVLNILGIPKVAGIGEIPYSILVIACLLQNKVRSQYKA